MHDHVLHAIEPIDDHILRSVDLISEHVLHAIELRVDTLKVLGCLLCHLLDHSCPVLIDFDRANHRVQPEVAGLIHVWWVIDTEGCFDFLMRAPRLYRHGHQLARPIQHIAARLPRPALPRPDRDQASDRPPRPERARLLQRYHRGVVCDNGAIDIRGAGVFFDVRRKICRSRAGCAQLCLRGPPVRAQRHEARARSLVVADDERQPSVFTLILVFCSAYREVVWETAGFVIAPNGWCRI
mmetsp:Transcript_139920/g.363698  ORF Transcript_139920/g.363698 Transcript_139920/m.363698 type:complete len:240 (+) Transcript_139920:275-994(+)